MAWGNQSSFILGSFRVLTIGIENALKIYRVDYNVLQKKINN